MPDAEVILSAISSSIQKASTHALDVSFNEILDMASSGELNITPDYQRLFRWSEGKRSRFIETLLLEMPVPPIFVIEEQEGTYQLIDGLQRISSYLHLRGQLQAEHLDPPIGVGELLKFSDCDIVPALNGYTYNDLPSSLQIRLKRAFIRMEVIRKETDPRFKYHMFKRLNTGGDILSDQQVRNASIRLLDVSFPDFIIDLSCDENFKIATATLTQERRLSAFDQELVLRFIALKNVKGRFKHEVSDFLTEYMESVADPLQDDAIDFDNEKAIFRKTFAVLGKSIGESAFSFANKDGTKLTAGFSIYHFEGVTIGMQSVLARLDPADPVQMMKFDSVLRAIKLDPEFISITTGGGKNSPGPLNDRIGFVRDRLQHAFG